MEGQEPATVEPGQEPEEEEGQEPDVASEPEAQEAEEPKRDEATVRQLKREAQQQRQRAREAEEKLQELLDQGKTEQERLVDAKTAAEKRAEEAETKALRYEVAAAAGLDLRAAEFLTGKNREELEERADELTKLLAEQARPASTSFDGGARQTPEKSLPPGEAHNELLLKQLGRSRAG